MAWSPDGARLSSGGEDRTVKVWEVRTQQKPLELGHAGARAVVWSSDGSRVAAVGGGRARIWNPTTGQELLSSDGLAWGPNGRHLVMQSGARAVKIWDVDKQNELLRRALHYTNNDEIDKAIDSYTEAIGLNPRLVIAYNNRGYHYLAKADCDKAIADLSKAIQLLPGNPLPYLHRASAYRGKGDWDRAIADASEAIRLDPKHGHGYEIRGEAYAERGDFDQAIRDLSKALKLNDQEAVLWYPAPSGRPSTRSTTQAPSSAPRSSTREEVG